MSENLVAYLVTLTILLALVAWVPVLEACREALWRLRWELIWRKLEAERREMLKSMETEMTSLR